jgi:hypothetical protein
MSAAEEWRQIDGFAGYEISSEGNVRSLHFSRPRRLSAWFDKDGYPCVTLGVGQRRYRRVHRLVAIAFHGAKRNALHREAAHLDGDRTNCRSDNLQWVSKRENHSHKLRHGTHQSGENHPRAKLTYDQVGRIRTRYASAPQLAKDFGVSRHTIYDIWRHVRWASPRPADPGR